MSLCTITDAFLAARTADGDEAAFAELARRYRPLMVSAAVGAPPGLDREDLRQEALLALLATCVVYDRSKGPFAGLACRSGRRRAAIQHVSWSYVTSCASALNWRDGRGPIGAAATAMSRSRARWR